MKLEIIVPGDLLFVKDKRFTKSGIGGWVVSAGDEYKIYRNCEMAIIPFGAAGLYVASSWHDGNGYTLTPRVLQEGAFRRDIILFGGELVSIKGGLMVKYKGKKQC